MTEWKFQRDAIRSFRFVRCDFDAHAGVAQLVYAFDEGPELVETITVPGAPFELDGARAAAAEQALRLLHLIAGVSYYKAAVPTDIRIDAYDIDADTAALLELIYVNGLGEFAYRNGLDLHGRIRFPRREGMRIDFLLGTPALAGRVTGALIDREERKGKGASDHAPVVVQLGD